MKNYLECLGDQQSATFTLLPGVAFQEDLLLGNLRIPSTDYQNFAIIFNYSQLDGRYIKQARILTREKRVESDFLKEIL